MSNNNGGESSLSSRSIFRKNGAATNLGMAGTASSMAGISSSAGGGTPSSYSSHQIELTDDETQLFDLLREVTEDTGLESTLRVAGGWVRDKLLATPDFQRSQQAYYHQHQQHSRPSASGAVVVEENQLIRRLTSKFQQRQPVGATNTPHQASMGRQGTKVIIDDDHQPVDIDIALDDMLGREFADHLNDFLSERGQETHSVGVVLKNPEKSKHLETATMKVGSFWIDFVNLRAEEYTQESRIPDLMRIGTPSEDSFRRDLTINALFYNINSRQVEDFTGRGFDDLKRGVVSTPVAPLTTLLDDPLRALRAVRFAARLRFTMDDSLIAAAMDKKVRDALAQKVSRERVGGEVDLMLRSPDPVGAMRLLINLNLVETVFPIEQVLPEEFPGGIFIFTNGLNLLSTTFFYLCENKERPPVWCEANQAMTTHGFSESTLLQDEDARRLLWYAAYTKPLNDYASLLPETQSNPGRGKKQNRSVIAKLLVDHLKRPTRDGDNVEKILRAADDFTQLMETGFDILAQSILLSGIQVKHESDDNDDDSENLCCRMEGKIIDSANENDPIWLHAMEFRLLTSKVLSRIGPLWRAALVLSLVEQLVTLNDDFLYTIEGDVFEESQEERRQGVIDRYDAFAAALQKLGLIGVWSRKPLIDGSEMKKILPNIPKGPIFREVMDEQQNWMTTHPGAAKDALAANLQDVFVEFV
eukprot:CAMPEP_0119005512 /NCGR_PEP_ID=MMETSP1176-20130426/1765_1 /TAXON_ID=265551 /ORGANISM="Synedropsis recta cf, Strain CCMP1620" /LENGTH=700 /DNA_ID=CAMNT_0006957331 /DNA_START=484 /DNA_END=2586 /DNA_ORIENTATION=+